MRLHWQPPRFVATFDFVGGRCRGAPTAGGWQFSGLAAGVYSADAFRQIPCLREVREFIKGEAQNKHDTSNS